MQDGYSASTPLSSFPLLLSFITGKSQQMRSFNSRREWWCALSLLHVGAEPLRFGVQSLASREFVTETDILIGPLTLGKTPSEISWWSGFFSHPYPKLKLGSLYTPLTTSSYTPVQPLFFQSALTHRTRFFSLCESIEESGADWWEIIGKSGQCSISHWLFRSHRTVSKLLECRVWTYTLEWAKCLFECYDRHWSGQSPMA